MNNTFNINRFGLLLRRQMQEFGKIFWVSLAVIAGAFFITYLYFVLRVEGDFQMLFRIPFFIIVGLLFLLICSSSFFAGYGQKSKAIVELMLPGSKLEKFFLGILLSCLMPIVCYVGLFLGVDYLMVNYTQSWIPADMNIPYAYKLIGPLEFSAPIVFWGLSIALVGNSLFLLGSIYFEKFHFLKSAICVIVISLFLGWLNYKSNIFLFEGKQRISSEAELDEKYLLYVFSATTFVLALAFWLVAYVRLKEKEV